MITVQIDDVVFTVHDDATVGVEVTGALNVISTQELQNLLNVSAMMARQASRQ